MEIIDIEKVNEASKHAINNVMHTLDTYDLTTAESLVALVSLYNSLGKLLEKEIIEKGSNAIV